MDKHDNTPPDLGAEVSLVEEPAAAAPSYLKLKKTLHAETTRLTLIANELMSLDPKSSVAPGNGAAESLAAMHLEVDLATLDVAALGDVLEQANAGDLNRYAKGAAKMAREELAVLEAAYKAVLAMDAANQPTRIEWSNLSASMLARRVNQIAHGFFKGRLPGWKD